MARSRSEHGAVGVAENGNSAFLVTVAARKLIDRRKVDLTEGLSTHPYHHEGSWAVGRYANSPWARPTTMAEAVALVERVQAAAARGAHASLEALAQAVPVKIATIAIRECPVLPSSTQQIIEDARAASVADSALYRLALAHAAEQRGWSVFWYNRDQVGSDAVAALGDVDLEALLRSMGQSVGPPWQAKHKLAATAALAARNATQ